MIINSIITIRAPRLAVPPSSESGEEALVARLEASPDCLQL